MSRFAVVADAVAGFAGYDTVVVDDGRVEAVTRRDQVDLPAEIHDGTILPTFTDSHIHPLGYAALVTGTSLKESRDMSDLRARLVEAAAGLPPGRALMAQRLDDLALGRLPDRADLDAAVPNRPLIVYRYCGHVAVVNTAALELAGIGPDTPDPRGGFLDRDDTGTPTGVLRETAIDLVAAHLDPLLARPEPNQIVRAMEGLVAVGIRHIGAMVATGRPLWCGVGDELTTICELAADLPLTADVMVITDRADDLEQAARRLGAAGGKVRFWGWKTFADGSLGGHTASMWSPFADLPSGRGTLRIGDREADLARTALDLGGVVAVHAIGDRAIDATLDMFESLVSEGQDRRRLRIEHASVPSAAAVARMADLGVVASIQPSFLMSESDWVPARLGPERLAYPFATMTQAGIETIAGSDCPVERPDPLLGIAAAVQRPGWNDSEHLDTQQATWLYTGAPARHFGRPDPLTQASPADLLVVSGEIGGPDARVETVFLAGKRAQPAPLPWPG